MAVDYFHRLVVWGRQPVVRAFTQSARRRARYALPGQRPLLTELIPFSFEALWTRRPLLRRFTAEPPCDPYHLRGYRMRSVGAGVSFARYQFQTRNMEMQEVARLLSLGEPRLAFVLVTLCLDASEVRSWFACSGRLSTYVVPDARLDDLIRDERAKLPPKARAEDDLDAARNDAEFAAIDEAMRRWDRRIAGFVSRSGTKDRRSGSMRASGHERSAPGWHTQGSLEWFDGVAKRDRQTDLHLILLDDTRRDPHLKALLGTA